MGTVMGETINILAEQQYKEYWLRGYKSLNWPLIALIIFCNEIIKTFQLQ